MAVLQYLNQSGCGYKTVKELLSYIRRLSFDGTYSFTAAVPQAQAEKVDENAEEEWIENGEEFEQSL